MMIRVAIVIALLISLVALSRFGLRMLEPVPSVLPITKQQDTAPTPVLPEESKVSYYPAVPQPLPDLKTGYLFTETRSVVEEGGGKGGPEKNGEPEVDINSVVYIGSLISGTIRKAIISAPPAKDAQQKAPPGKTGRVATGRRAVPQAKAKEFARVMQGEMFRGYKVKLVSPDKIVFERGEEVVERLLYDSSKKERATGPPSYRGPAMSGGQMFAPPPLSTPDHQMMAEPSESRQIVVGGSDNIVAEPQQPTAIIRRSPRAPVQEGETQPQGVLLERPPR